MPSGTSSVSLLMMSSESSLIVTSINVDIRNFPLCPGIEYNNAVRPVAAANQDVQAVGTGRYLRNLRTVGFLQRNRHCGGSFAAPADASGKAGDQKNGAEKQQKVINKTAALISLSFSINLNPCNLANTMYTFIRLYNKNFIFANMNVDDGNIFFSAPVSAAQAGMRLDRFCARPCPECRVRGCRN